MGDWYINGANSIIIDDRGVGVFRGGRAYLSKERAEKIRAIRPGLLPDENQSPVSIADSKAEELVEVEIVTDDGQSDLVARLFALHYKKRIKIAESLGGGKNLSRRKADNFLRDLPDDALAALELEVESNEG